MIFFDWRFFDIKNFDLKLFVKKHEVIALIVRDKFEETPVELGNVSFIDPNTNIVFESVLNKNTIDEYIKKLKRMTINFIIISKNVLLDSQKSIQMKTL